MMKPKQEKTRMFTRIVSRHIWFCDYISGDPFWTTFGFQHVILMEYYWAEFTIKLTTKQPHSWWQRQMRRHRYTLAGGNQWQFKWLLHRKGLEHVPFWTNSPLPFPCKSLTDREKWYANIELLAIVFACQHVCPGKTIHHCSNHKLFKMIHEAPCVCSSQLQLMLLKLQKYNTTICYRPGKEMLLTDALNWWPLRSSQEIKMDLRVD